MTKENNFHAHVDFIIGQRVKLNFKQGGIEGMVTAIKFCADGGVLYNVTWSDMKNENHFAIELKAA
jgi:hypothetical protein